MLKNFWVTLKAPFIYKYRVLTCPRLDTCCHNWNLKLPQWLDLNNDSGLKQHKKVKSQPKSRNYPTYTYILMVILGVQCAPPQYNPQETRHKPKQGQVLFFATKIVCELGHNFRVRSHFSSRVIFFESGHIFQFGSHL